MISELTKTRVSKRIPIKVYVELDRTDVEILNSKALSKYVQCMRFEWHNGIPYGIYFT